MRGLRMLGVAAVALAVGLVGASSSFASQDDVYTSYTQPSNALVMPFDASNNRQSFFVVSNLGGFSNFGNQTLAGVTTHWSYWSENCDHLADVYACLTLNDTVVVDPTNIRSVDAANQAYGPSINLSGKQGFVVVTAYETGPECGDASYAGYKPVDNAIVGTYTLADTTSGASLGADAIGLGLGSDNQHTQLPAITTDAIDIQTFRPDSLDLSAVILLSLKEHAGSGATSFVEVGPNNKTITTSVTYYDNTETATSLPDAEVNCAEFNTLTPGTGNLIPGTVSGLSAGIFRMGSFEPNIGGDTGRWIYAVYGQAVGRFGAGSNGKYRVLGSNQ